jgi:uncharacterized protein DUF5615
LKILLDECVDRRFGRELVGHDVATVQESNWTGKKNGELLALAAEQFQVFVTVDRNLYFQQNQSKLKIAVMILAARTNRLADLKPLAPSVMAILTTIQPGPILVITPGGPERHAG